MWIREVVFQGIFNAQRPARVRIEEGFCRLRLPKSVDAQHFQLLILSLLFPTSIREHDLQPLLSAPESEFRAGLVLAVQNDGVRHDYKVFRQFSDASVILQDITDNRNRELARGVQAVERSLRQYLNLPPYDDFACVSMWRMPNLHQEGAAGLTDPEDQRLVNLYTNALLIEENDLALENTRARLKEAQNELEVRAKPLREIQKLEDRVLAQEVITTITEEEREQVRSQKQIDSTIMAKIRDVEESLEDLAGRLDEDGSPPPLVQQPLLILTVILAIGVYIASAVTGIRLIALANVLILGGTTFLVFRHFDRLEDDAKDQTRLQQLERRITQLNNERTQKREAIRSVMDKANASSLHDFERALDAYDEDLRELEDLRAKGISASIQAAIDEQRAVIDSIELEIETLERKRSEFGEYTMPSYELERSLEDRGLQPERFKPKHTPKRPMPEKPTGTLLDAFPSLGAIARDRGLLSPTGPHQELEDVWNKLAVHLMGRTWKGISLQPNGELIVPQPLRQGVEDWAQRKPKMVELLLSMLAASILLSTPKEHPLNQSGWFCVADPYQGLDDERRARLDTVFKSLSTRSHVVVLVS